MSLHPADVIAGCRFHWSTEADLQAGIHAALVAAGLDAVREVRLSSRDRIDVLCGTVGIEVKVSHAGRRESAERITRQLTRYAEHDQITELVLVSSSPRHRRVPDAVAGVPVRVVIVGGLR